MTKQKTVLFSVLFSYLFLFQSFAQISDVEDLKTSNFIVYKSFYNNHDNTEACVENFQVLSFIQDSIENKIHLWNRRIKKETTSYGNLELVVDPSQIDDNPEGKLFFLWDYWNDYNDKSGTAFVVFEEFQTEEDEKFYGITIEVPGRMHLIYYTTIKGSKGCFIDYFEKNKVKLSGV